MGQVYKGVHPGIGSRVAIKFLSRELSEDPVLVERFFSEARAVNVIRHESIVNVLDLAVTADGRPYIVMEYLDGAPLSAVIKQAGALPIGSSIQLTVEVLAALEAAHSRGIVHRDIKPENLFVSPSGRVKLLDFGIAKLRPGVLPVAHETRTGVLLGTPQYMSPEQAMGREADARADIYSVGIVLYQMVSGRLPFGADNLYELLKQHVETLPPTPRVYRPEVTPQLEWVLLGALQKDPAQRFQSASAMSEALTQVLPELPTTAFLPLLPSLAGKGQRGPLQGISTPPRTPPAASPLNAGTTPVLSPAPWNGRRAEPGQTPAPSNSAVAPNTAFALILASTFTLLFLVAAIWFGISTFRRMNSYSEPKINPITAGTTTKSSASPPPLNSRQGSHPAASSPPPADVSVPGFAAIEDRHHVPVKLHFERAARAARLMFADSELIRIDITGMHPDGSVDVDVSGEFQSSILFRFRSPSLSKPKVELPSGAIYRAECQFHYLVNEYGMRSYRAGQLECDEPTLPLPKCTPIEIWARAVSTGAPRGNHIGNLSYFATQGQGPRWAISIEGFTQLQLDDCEPGKD
jgi:serine/threonine protein kinase